MKKYLLIASLVCTSAYGANESVSHELSLGEVLIMSPGKPGPGGPGGPGDLPADHPCKKLNLTDAQKSSIKELMYQHAQDQAQNEANIKKALLTMHHTLASAQSTKDEGEKAQDAALSAFSMAGKSMANLDLAVTYDVLQPDQRENAILCKLLMKGPKKPHQP